MISLCNLKFSWVRIGRPKTAGGNVKVSVELRRVCLDPVSKHAFGIGGYGVARFAFLCGLSWLIEGSFLFFWALCAGNTEPVGGKNCSFSFEFGGSELLRSGVGKREGCTLDTEMDGWLLSGGSGLRFIGGGIGGCGIGRLAKVSVDILFGEGCVIKGVTSWFTGISGILVALVGEK